MEWVPSLRHTQHACSPTVAGNVKSHYLCCPSYPSSFPLFFPLYTPHAVKSQDFSPPFCLLYPFKFKYFLQLLLFFFLLWQKSSSLNWLLLAPMATTLPLHLPLSFNPHQSFPKFQLTPLPPFNPLATLSPHLELCWPQVPSEKHQILFNNVTITHTYASQFICSILCSVYENWKAVFSQLCERVKQFNT